MMIDYFIVLSYLFVTALSYSNNWISVFEEFSEVPQLYGCGFKAVAKGGRIKLNQVPLQNTEAYDATFPTLVTSSRPSADPMNTYDTYIRKLLFGDKAFIDRDDDSMVNLKLPNEIFNQAVDKLGQYPSGNVLRAELFQNRTGVHLPMPEFMQRGHLFLKETSDYMQTAVNAFSIFLEGTVDDILRLPAIYVLKSARTIAMMKIAKEKLAATWTVVKGDYNPDEISYTVLQMYRPLFKYLNGREIARLNLSDPRILTYIGTHADLDRHQVGVVAGTYIKQNPEWTDPKYLNLMNNLLCGVPMTFMRKIPENTYLQLTHQVFYHIRACDPLQRRFYLTMMTKTQALGKSYSWSARDVSRLGLLLSDVEGPDLAAINPEAMSGITAQVMLEIPATSLRYITEKQLGYIGQKPLNILAKRLRAYQDQVQMYSGVTRPLVTSVCNLITLFWMVNAGCGRIG